jgi:hypothetical protein
MQWLGPEIAAKYESPRWPVVLSVCPDIDRMQSREHTLHAAGFVVASASTIFAAQEMCDLCSFDVVLLDRECACDGAAADLQQRFLSVLIEPGVSEHQLISRLSEVLQIATAPAAVH